MDTTQALPDIADLRLTAGLIYARRQELRLFQQEEIMPLEEQLEAKKRELQSELNKLKPQVGELQSAIEQYNSQLSIQTLKFLESRGEKVCDRCKEIYPADQVSLYAAVVFNFVYNLKKDALARSSALDEREMFSLCGECFQAEKLPRHYSSGSFKSDNRRTEMGQAYIVEPSAVGSEYIISEVVIQEKTGNPHFDLLKKGDPLPGCFSPIIRQGVVIKIVKTFGLPFPISFDGSYNYNLKEDGWSVCDVGRLTEIYPRLF